MTISVQLRSYLQIAHVLATADALVVIVESAWTHNHDVFSIGLAKD